MTTPRRRFVAMLVLAVFVANVILSMHLLTRKDLNIGYVLLISLIFALCMEATSWLTKTHTS